MTHKAGEGAGFRWADDPKANAGMTVWSAFPWIYDPEGNKIELWEPLKPL